MPPSPAVAAAPATIVVVDTDPTLRRAIAAALLRRAVHRVIEAESVAAARAACGAGAVDLVAASARLPDAGAEALCAEMRRHRGPPVVAYRVGAAADAHIRWLDAGGADSVAGDDPVLVAARCGAALRRARTPPPPWSHPTG
ncbi:hypothetical protein HC251_08545 [Iamia sp. SCSIO 61187]|uniref:hypothetical protein n=1 Tax=Iamia sp. SCSIO 61187 TaxID=2722752 RepID=UPI001C636809|nr:hypothetical protein [Iamia sp. SCSIO 61187]QYG92485.1 hypothetical protein HC251_08545 [Iamia sp. SCSIO 61187]